MIIPEYVYVRREHSMRIDVARYPICYHIYFDSKRLKQQKTGAIRLSLIPRVYIYQN